MEGLHPIPQTKKQPTKNCLFSQQIQKVERYRATLQTKIRKSKQKMKENLQTYLSKKLIIPQSLSNPTKSFYTNPPHLIKSKDTDQCIIDYPNYDEPFQTRNQDDHNPDVMGSYEDVLNKMERKWKLGLTPDDMNSLFLGKELRIGYKSRKHYISDDRLIELKTAIHFRNRPKYRESQENKKLNKNRKGQDYKKVSNWTPRALNPLLNSPSLQSKRSEKDVKIKFVGLEKRTSSHYMPEQKKGYPSVQFGGVNAFDI